MIKKELKRIGFAAGQNVMIHSSFKQIRNSFSGISIEEIISDLKDIIGASGSILIPAFTYCFKKKDGSHEIFDRNNSSSKVGSVSEIFRKSNNVLRTSSPTHSFALWGKAADLIEESNNPTSPLGIGSPIDWFIQQPDSFVVMLGTGFNSFTLGHYLEIAAPVPWSDISPWDHLGVEKIGVSLDGETELIEIPGCSKSFVNFEKYLLKNKFICRKRINQLDYYFLPVKTILELGLDYFRNSKNELICPGGTCAACDERRSKLNKLGISIK